MNKVSIYVLNLWSALKNDLSYVKHLENVVEFLAEELKNTEALLKATQDEAEFLTKKTKATKKTK